MSNNVRRILLSCINWDFVQYLTSLLLHRHPQAILRISTNLDAVIREAEKEPFDTLILDERILPDGRIPPGKISSLRPDTKVYILTDSEAKLKAAKMRECNEFITHCRSSEISQIVKDGL